MRWTGFWFAFVCKIVLSIFLAFSFACAPERPSDRERIAQDYPRVDGSTSTHPLSVLIACKIQDVAYEWRMPPASERTVFPLRKGRPLLAARIEETVHHHGTHQAYLALIQKKADLILVARGPSERESAAARAAGLGLEVSPIARDALVFVVHAKNPVDSLNLNGIRAIYGMPGTRSWSGLGGAEATIQPFQRQPDSGSQELMEGLVMRGSPIRDAREVPRIYTMGGVVNTVALHENGIGYSIYYYVTNMAPNKHVRMIGVEGVRPSAETIAAGTYPLTTEVFVVLRSGIPRESPAALLRDWLQTAEGQAAVQESGYVRMKRP